MSLQFYIGASGSGKSYELYDKITLEASIYVEGFDASEITTCN